MPENVIPTWNLIISLISGLAGAAVGLWGARWLETRRERRARNAAVLAIRIEMALIAAALETAVLDHRRTRIEITKPNWFRFSPELFNYIPLHLAKTLYLQMEDEFDAVLTAYQLLTSQALTEQQLNEISGQLLAWSKKTDELNLLLEEHFSGRLARIKSRLGFKQNEDDAFIKLNNELEQQTRPYLRQLDFEVDDNGVIRAGPFRIVQDPELGATVLRVSKSVADGEENHHGNETG